MIEFLLPCISTEKFLWTYCPWAWERLLKNEAFSLNGKVPLRFGFASLTINWCGS